jgi:hypothetical protein
VILTSKVELFEDAIPKNIGMEVLGEALIFPTDKERIAL